LAAQKFPLSAEIWKQAIAGWTAAAKAKGAALVKLDITSDGASYRVFALPIFIGAEPTAAGAIAADRPDALQGYVVLGYDLAPSEWFAADATAAKAEASRTAALY